MATKETKSEEAQLEELREQRKELNKQISAIKSRNNWTGQGGIWHTFRQIGKRFYNVKGMDSSVKVEKLRAEIDAFVKERL